MIDSRAKNVPICNCLDHGQILSLLNTSVQEPARYAVSLCGKCEPAYQMKSHERNNNNYHRLDRRENEFSDAVRGVDRQPGGERCSIIRYLLWVMDEQQLEQGKTVYPCLSIGHPTVISRVLPKESEFSCNSTKRGLQ